MNNQGELITNPTTEALISQRRWDIDLMRVLVVMLFLIPYHSWVVFNTFDDWYVKNGQSSTALNWFTYFGDAVGMQLLFLLAGSATWFALRRRSGGQYARERIRRLLVPLVFSLLVLVPPQVYLGLLGHSDFQGSFLEWFPNFFTVYPEDIAGISMGGFGLGHMWFVLFLLVIALVALPLLLFFRRPTGKKVLGAVAAFCSRPGAILLLVIPIFVAERLLDVYPNPLYFLTLFVLGFMIMADERFEDAIARHKKLALWSGLLALVLFVAWADWGLRDLVDIPGWVETTYRRSLMAWLLIVAMLGYGKKYLNAPPKRKSSRFFLSYFGEGSYPFYILHQTVIVVIAFFVVQWAAGVTVKYLVIATGAYLGTIVLYDLFVRRTNPTRFLLGMRPRRRPE